MNSAPKPRPTSATWIGRRFISAVEAEDAVELRVLDQLLEDRLLGELLQLLERDGRLLERVLGFLELAELHPAARHADVGILGPRAEVVLRELDRTLEVLLRQGPLVDAVLQARARLVVRRVALVALDLDLD